MRRFIVIAGVFIVTLFVCWLAGIGGGGDPDTHPSAGESAGYEMGAALAFPILIALCVTAVVAFLIERRD